jgi:hypothetical protein
LAAAHYKWGISPEDLTLGTTSIPVLAVQVVALFLASTIAFDCVHYGLHVLADSRFRPLRRIGALHSAHHAFLDRNLEIDDAFLRANLVRHVIPEFLTQAGFSLSLLWLLPPALVGSALALQLLVFLLILAHGDGGGGATGRPSYVAAIEQFKRAASDRKLPIEVWALGSQGEWTARPQSRASRAFARHARRYYVDDRIIYRHIASTPIRVPAGRGRLTAPLAARIAFFFIRRGFNYVPVTLSATALLYFVSFRWFVRPAPAPAG